MFEPFRLVDADGQLVVPWLRTFCAGCGRRAGRATHRSYGMDLLRWWRFLRAAGVGWDQATRTEARDFCRGSSSPAKPARPHWRYPGGGAPGTVPARAEAGTPNPVTGKPSPGRGYAIGDGGALRDACCAVFYDFHLEAGQRAAGEPVPAGQETPRAGARASQSSGCLPGAAGRAVTGPGSRSASRGSIPDGCSMSCSPRCRRTGTGPWSRSGSPRARGPRNCSASRREQIPGSQLVTVIRKGSRAVQPLPAVAGRVRVAAALPGGDARPGAVRAGRPAVVDAAAPVPAAVLSRGPRDVHPRQCGAGGELVAARSSAFGRLPDGTGPGACRLPTFSGSWAMRICPRRRFTSRPRPRM